MRSFHSRKRPQLFCVKAAHETLRRSQLLFPSFSDCPCEALAIVLEIDTTRKLPIADPEVCGFGQSTFQDYV